jgi:O-acetyl-ADP-ribose deacetylase
MHASARLNNRHGATPVTEDAPMDTPVIGTNLKAGQPAEPNMLRSISMPRIVIQQADITTLQVDAIVNAANETLLGGGGVDGAIHRAAGPELLRECRTLGGCPTGEARITRGYRLPAGYVIHAVGPRYHDGHHGEPDLLAGAYRHSLELAVAHSITTIAFPAISCGVYGYPIPAASDIAISTVARFLAANETITQVIFACFSAGIRDTFQTALDRLPIPD